ncbi:hypothetical protein LJX78_06410 [Methanimicrococcus blatticola]|nr:hypothetical protein [Methanimicrococcus blatticola]MBZ3935590.1 hypothetical protein [Methanimicrococcus blatticola]MCC2509231.1 hypothetical protein [Methanimicrococcus blatticola]
MTMKKAVPILVLLILSIFLICPAYGDSQIAPYSYSIEFEEYGTVFYMTTDSDSYPFIDTSHLPETGLYKIDTLENIYTMDEYFYETDLYFTPDGMNFAAMTWQETNEERCVRFFENGKEYKHYSAAELMEDPSKRSFSASHYNWREYQEREEIFDQNNSTLSVVTLDGVYCQFDIKTGEILQKEEANPTPAEIICGKMPLWQLAIPLLIILLIGGGLYWYWKKRNKN